MATDAELGKLIYETVARKTQGLFFQRDWEKVEQYIKDAYIEAAAEVMAVGYVGVVEREVSHES